jgi:hypothetical protein
MLHVCKKAFGVGLVFKPGDNVVGIPHKDDIPSGVVSTPPLRPEVEDVVEVDVCQQW